MIYQHRRCAAHTVIRSLLFYPIPLLNLGVEVLRGFCPVAVFLAPLLVSFVDSTSAKLTALLLLDVLVKELAHLIRKHLVVHRGLLDRIGHGKPLTAIHPVALQHPVQDAGHILRIGEELLQTLVLLVFLEVPVKRDYFDSA